MIRDQGISKAGNRRVRALRIQLAGLWLRYQPDSKHSRWFQERFGGGRKRQRRNEVTGCEPARIEGGQGTGSAHPLGKGSRRTRSLLRRDKDFSLRSK